MGVVEFGPAKCNTRAYSQTLSIVLDLRDGNSAGRLGQNRKEEEEGCSGVHDDGITAEVNRLTGCSR